MNLDRSRIVARDGEQPLTEHENRTLLERLDRAYSDPPTAEEAELARQHRRGHRRLVEGSW